MNRIKYYDKLDAIRYRSFYSLDFNIKSNSLQDLIDKIKNNRKYKTIKNSIPYIQIEIESLDDNTFVLLEDVFPRELSMLNAKKLASAIAFNRVIALSPDFSEIYFEKIHVKINDATSTELYFDYSLLYGDYNKIEFTKPIISDVPWEMYSTKTSCYIVHGLINNPDDIIITNNLIRDGIYCMYEGDLYDKDNNLIGCIEYAENPIPLSLIYKYMR